MKTKQVLVSALLALSIINCQLSTAHAQGTAFTYQGRLNDSGGPANGNYDMTFAIYDAVTNGDLLAPALTNAPTVASNGLFTVTLDPGAGIFTGAARWLEIAVRTNGSVGAYTILSPRQQLTATPYAITASNLTGNLPAVQLSGTVPLAQLPGAVVTNNAGGLALGGTFNGTLAGDGSGLTSLNTSQLTSPGNTNGGYANFFVGPAGNASTSGAENTASGDGALANNTTGAGNTANGNGVLANNTTGSYNTADGDEALFANTSGVANTANGFTAL